MAVAVNSGTRAKAVMPMISPVSQAEAIQGAYLVAISLSQRVAAETTSIAARAVMGIQNPTSTNTSFRTAWAAMMMRTTQATAEARLSSEARNRAIAC